MIRDDGRSDGADHDEDDAIASGGADDDRGDGASSDDVPAGSYLGDDGPPSEDTPVSPKRASGDYVVGYGKPPKHSQFKKGDPRFKTRRKRPKKTIGAIIEEELGRSVRVEENGRRRNITMEKLIVRRLVNASAKKDMRANKLLMEWRIRFKDGPDTTLDDISAEDAAIIDDFLLRGKNEQS